MKFLKRFAVLFYVILVLFFGIITLLFCVDIPEILGVTIDTVSFERVQRILYGIHMNDDLKLAVSIIAGGLLLINFVFYRLLFVNSRKERVIAFDNPSGRVKVSLAAIEDLIKRKLFKLEEINEVKPFIVVAKKGLLVKLKVVFSSEINIPEATSKVQELVKKKVHDMIGIDEPVNVTIYVGKILPDSLREKSLLKKPKEKEESEPEIPFRGYRT